MAPVLYVFIRYRIVIRQVLLILLSDDCAAVLTEVLWDA